MTVPPSRPPGILIADDEEVICFSLSRELRRRGLTVFVVADGVEALAMFRAHVEAIDAVILDVRMPRLGGRETLRSLRRLNPGLRCCLMTAYDPAPGDDADGTVEVLRKPFDLDAFVRVVAGLTARTDSRGFARIRPASQFLLDPVSASAVSCGGVETDNKAPVPELR